jgi:hypothetical protein
MHAAIWDTGHVRGRTRTPIAADREARTLDSGR